MDHTKPRRFLTLLGLFAATAWLATAFIGWPLNRDITTYATIAQELLQGKQLYVDVWDIKPPAIFATYMLAQWVIPAKALQIFLLDLVPTLVVLTALVHCAKAAGFRWTAGVWSGLFWVALSGDIVFQTQEPNTEIFINACCACAFLQVLGLGARAAWSRSLAIGALFGLACTYKTVAIAVAVGMGAAHLFATLPGASFSGRLRQLLLMAAAGALSLAGVVAYFAATGRFDVFWEAMVDSGVSYGGDVWQNVITGVTFAPIIGDDLLLRWILAVGPWVLIAAIAVLDRDRRRSWVLLGAYAFSSLIAVALPGNFYAHYFQLLLPPLCLGLGWFLGDLLPRLGARRAMPVFGGLLLAGLSVHELKTYRSSAEDALTGTYQELYLETEALGRRLGDALEPNEVLYQWGEESGLYWHSGKRPPAAVLTFPLLSGPQAERLTGQTLESLKAQAPDLIVAVNYMLDNGDGHPVFEWIRSNYKPVEPAIPGEREFFTFYVPVTAPLEFVQRVLGSGAESPRAAASAKVTLGCGIVAVRQLESSEEAEFGARVSACERVRR